MDEIISIPGFNDPFSSISHLLGAGIFAILSIFLLRRGRGDRAHDQPGRVLRRRGFLAFDERRLSTKSPTGMFHRLGNILKRLAQPKTKSDNARIFTR